MKETHLLKKLILQSNHRYRLWLAIGSLFLGTFLLLLSVLIWWNFNELLNGNNQNDSLGSTFLIINKKVTDQTMGNLQASLFTLDEIEELKKAPQVQQVGIISSNHFPVYAVMGGRLGFSTDLPLESVPDSFLDQLPNNWKWDPNSPDLPIIISNQFLDIYNYVFAPSQDLPQLSQTSVKSLSLKLTTGEKDNETWVAHVVGFSDRINAVLVPQSFIDYGNKKFPPNPIELLPSQIILKTKDPSNTHFTNFLSTHNYSTNAQNLRWSKVREIVNTVTLAIGILSIFFLAIGVLVIILFIELTVAKARLSIILLLQLGYSPLLLRNFILKHFFPILISTNLIAMGITCFIQFIFSIALKNQNLYITAIPGLPVWIAFLINTFILLILVTNSIKNTLFEK